MSKFVEEGLLF